MSRHVRSLLAFLATSTLLLAGACRDAPTAVEPFEGAKIPTFLSTATGLPPFDEEMAELGDMIFDDENLSINRNQSCASCHAAEWGFTGPHTAVNAAGSVYEGSIPGRLGDRKPPSSAYSTLSPVLHIDGEGLFVGGNFWDGRATGARFGDRGGPAIEQAQGPFLNPMEQGLRDEACVVFRVSRSPQYGALYREIFGTAIDAIVYPDNLDYLCGFEGERFDIDEVNRGRIQKEYDNIAVAIAMYEESHNLFSSKFDAVRLGLDKFSGQERRGFELFNGKAGCSNCHVSEGRDPHFTDHTFDNLGVPVNPMNPETVKNPSFRDPGLGGFLVNHETWSGHAQSQMGKMRVPTLRNVAMTPKSGRGDPQPTKAYMHNGAFKSLKEVVQFYNTRDVLRTCGPRDTRNDWGTRCWPAPQFPETMNREELGNLGLTEGEVNAIVAFLGTLSDGHFPRRKGKHFQP
jgi:cytochrome c peroxidase